MVGAGQRQPHPDGKGVYFWDANGKRYFDMNSQLMCVNIVLKNGPTLGKGHMTWQLNEINKLIWPSPAGIGMMDKALWDQTIQSPHRRK